MYRSNRFAISILTLGLLLAGNWAARAQSSSPDPGQGEPQAQAPGPEDLDDQKLNLSADQKNQIKQIHENAKSQIRGIRNDSSLTAEQKEQKIRQIRQDTHKQVLGVLTPEQRKIWKARHRERRAHRRHHRRRHS